MDVKKIGEAIRYLRLKEGYTQQDIADYLNISFQAVSKWERGLCLPDATYLPQLAEYLNVELDDLLEGHITYLNDEWQGILSLLDIKINAEELQPRISDVMLAYFMLAGISHITILANPDILSFFKGLYDDGRNFGLTIDYNPNCFINDTSAGIMLIYDLVFLYGTNLTKYFWRAMDRKNYVTMLAKERNNDQGYGFIEYNKNNAVKSLKTNNYRILPIIFIPQCCFSAYNEGIDGLIEDETLYAEPIARGMISYLLKNNNDINNTTRIISLIETMTGERLYDLNEIAEKRFLKK